MNKVMTVALASAFALSLNGPLALADDPSVKSIGSVGLMTGKSGDKKEVAGVLSLTALRTQQPSTENGFASYGQGTLRLEAGTGLGVALRGKSGTTLIGAGNGVTVAPHVGLELLSMNFSVNTNDNREDFIEWSPMAALGVQGNIGNLCKVVANARAGGSIGTLGKGGARAAYGAGVDSHCLKMFNLSANATRIATGTGPVDLQSADFRVMFPGTRANIGVSAEAITTRAESSKSHLFQAAKEEDKKEKRVFLHAGTSF